MFVLTPQLATTLTITQILNMFAKVLKRMEYSDSQNLTCLNTQFLFTSFGSFLAVFHSKCRWMIILDQFNWLISCERTSFCWFLMSTRPKFDMKICGMFICTIFFFHCQIFTSFWPIYIAISWLGKQTKNALIFNFAEKWQTILNDTKNNLKYLSNIWLFF